MQMQATWCIMSLTLPSNAPWPVGAVVCAWLVVVEAGSLLSRLCCLHCRGVGGGAWKLRVLVPTCGAVHAESQLVHVAFLHRSNSHCKIMRQRCVDWKVRCQQEQVLHSRPQLDAILALESYHAEVHTANANIDTGQAHMQEPRRHSQHLRRRLQSARSHQKGSSGISAVQQLCAHKQACQQAHQASTPQEDADSPSHHPGCACRGSLAPCTPHI